MTSQDQKQIVAQIREHLLPHCFNAAVKAGAAIMKIYKNSDVKLPEITARQIYSGCSENEIILCKASHSIQAYRIYECIEKLYESEGFFNA